MTNYVALNGSVTLDFDLSPTSSGMVAYGDEFPPSAGSVTINVNNVSGFGSGTYNLLTAETNLDAGSFSLGNVPGGFSCALAVSGSSLGLVVTATPPVITSGSDAAGTRGMAFSYQIAGTHNPTSFSAVGLPAGLSLNTFTGLISGTPSATGTSGVTIKAINAGGTGSSTLRILVQTAIDSWRSQNFTAAELTDPGISGGTADPNHNGIPNLLEYALNGDPNGNITSENIRPQVSLNNSTNSLQLAFNRYLDRNDITITVQAADNLTGLWTDLAGNMNGAGFNIITPGASVLETGTGNTRAVTISDLYPITNPAHPKRFMRVKVTK